MNSMIRFGWINCRDAASYYVEGRLSRAKRAVFKSYVMLATLHWREVWCLKDNNMGTSQETGIHGESNVWSTSQRYKKTYGLDVDVGFN